MIMSLYENWRTSIPCILYLIYLVKCKVNELLPDKSNSKAINRNWSNQKANPALKTKAGDKQTLQIDKIQ